MLKQFLKIFLMAALIVATHGSALAADTETCEVINSSDMSIAFLYAAPMDSEDWGNDLVGTEIMNLNDRRTITYDISNPRYKIKIQLAGEGGETFTWYDVDLSDAWRLTLYYNGTDFELAKNSRG